MENKKNVEKKLKKIVSTFKNPLKIKIRDLIGKYYDEIFLLDWDFLFLGLAKNIKKSRVIATFILIRQYYDPKCHAVVLRKELKTHDNTTVQAFGWVLGNTLKKYLPNFVRQYEYQKSYDWYVRHLPDGNKQYILFKGLDKGMDKLSGSDDAYGYTGIYWNNEPVSADDRFKRGGFDNEKWKYNDDIARSSLTRNAPKPLYIYDMNAHTPDFYIINEIFEKETPADKKLLETKGKIVSYNKKYNEIIDPKTGKRIGYQKSLTMRMSYKVNEFMSPTQYAEVARRKKYDQKGYETIDLGIVTRATEGVFSDLVSNLNLFDFSDKQQIDEWKERTDAIDYFSQGLDFGLTDWTCTSLLGFNKETRSLFFLKTDFWKGEKWDSSDKTIGQKKIAREKWLAKNTVIKTIENSELYPKIKKDSHVLWIDYQNSSFMGLILDQIKIMGKNINLSWLSIALQSLKYDVDFGKLEKRIRAFRIILSRSNNFFDLNLNKKVLEMLQKYAGREDEKTWMQDMFDNIWYAIVPYMNWLLSPQDWEQLSED